MAQPVLRAGELDRMIEIRAVNHALDAYGDPVPGDGPLVTTCHAKRMEQRLSEVFSAGADQAAATVVWRIRARDDVDEKMIVIYRTQRFEIRSVQEYGRGVGLDLVCERLGVNV